MARLAVDSLTIDELASAAANAVEVMLVDSNALIEVLISARVQGEVGLKKRGDILVAKLPGAQWGSEERGAVVEWEDLPLAAELRSLRDAGEPHPVIVHPYEQTETLANERVVQVNRSRIHVNLDAIAANDRLRIESRTTADPPLGEARLTTRLRAKETQGGVAEPDRAPPRTRATL